MTIDDTQHPAGPGEARACREGTVYAGLLGERATGLLDSDDAAAVDRHVATCRPCREGLSDALIVADALSDLAPASEPPADLRGAVLAAVAADAASVEAAAAAAAPGSTPLPDAALEGRSPVRRGARWRRLAELGRNVAVPALAAACLVLVVQVRTGDRQVDRMQVRLDRYEGERTLSVLKGADVATLDTSGALHGARAQVAIKDGVGIVAMREVPAPPRGSVWQVWVVDDEQRITSIGTIERAEQVVLLPIEQEDDDRTVERVMITSEPIGGSEVPAGIEVGESRVA